VFPEARWHHHDPIAEDIAHEGARLAFGEAVDTIHDFSVADVTLALDADFLGAGPDQVRYAADFAAARRNTAPAVQRLYVAESSPTLTGVRADHRFILRPDEMPAFANTVAATLGVSGPGADTGGSGPVPSHLMETLIEDLRRAGSRAVVVAGRQQPAWVHALVHAINESLGAVGTTIFHVEPVARRPAGEAESLRALAGDIAAGQVSHLFILDSNPAYTAPADLGFAEMLSAVPFAVHLGLHVDETAAVCRWHLPQAHALESWGDARAFDGTISLRQPVRTPPVPSSTPSEVLALLLGEIVPGDAILRRYWQQQWQGAGQEQGENEAAFATRWNEALHDGVIQGSALAPRTMTVRDDWAAEADMMPPPAGVDEPGGFTIVFTPDPGVWDGRYANNGWLQELPKPLTKLVWGNAALLAPRSAEALGVEPEDVIEIELGGRRIQAPVWIAPGHAENTVTLPLGYGRTRAGRIGSGIGFNAYALRTVDAPWTATGARVTATGERHSLVSTQSHHDMGGRDIVRVVTAEALNAPGHRAETAAELPSIYPDWPYPGHAWGMTIDLDACIGCNACVVACQAENNTPVVGEQEVANGREMHWLRIDRYYEGPAEDPATYFQPVLCMHCEKAPCEPVCPVNATVHSSEGLNDMVYNRCIGTRTCSNNCPYKVRRFNWFDYAQMETARPAAAHNPAVTVRARGVMEKCTYCVQRISAARIVARQENRAIGDGEIVTACQQACPTRAIVFGDINDPGSAVSRIKTSPRNYALLGELNTRPRTTYLERIVNPPLGPPPNSPAEPSPDVEARRFPGPDSGMIDPFADEHE
jgi:Fe-S-cluster-containing dehydrogenase component